MYLVFENTLPKVSFTTVVTAIGMWGYMPVRTTGVLVLHSGALVLRTKRQSTRMSKIKNGELDQYVAEPFKHQQFGTAGIEGVKMTNSVYGDQ